MALADDIAFVALGSNLGDRAGYLRAALDALTHFPFTRVIECSPLFETDPVGAAGQGRYLNAVARLQASLSPQDLMQRLLEIEMLLGRDRRNAERWGPRTLDLDLLMFGDRVIQEPRLTLPHPRLADRAFVLEPWRLIAPDVVVPGHGLSVQDLACALASREAMARLPALRPAEVSA